MDLPTRIEREVQARVADDTARKVTEELRRHLASMTLGDLHAFLSTELGRRAFHVPLADIMSIPIREAEGVVTPEAEDASGEHLTWKEANQRFQVDLIRKALIDVDWNVLEAARRLELSRSHIYTMIDRFAIDQED